MSLLLITNPSSIEESVQVVWRYFGVVAGIAFIVAFAWRVFQSYTLTMGHLLVGSLAVATVTAVLLVFIFARPFGWFFWPFGVLFTAGWLVYNNWYVWNYPKVFAWLKSAENAPRPPGGNTLLGRFLLKHPGQKTTVTPFQMATGLSICAFFFLLAFALIDRLDGIAYTNRVATNASKRVDTAVVNVKRELSTAVKPLIDNQESILVEAKAAKTAALKTATITAGRFDQLDKLGQKKPARRPLSERVSRPVPVYPSLLQPKTSITPTLPIDRVQPVQPVPVAPGRSRRPGKNQTSYVPGDTLRRDSVEVVKR